MEKSAKWVISLGLDALRVKPCDLVLVQSRMPAPAPPTNFSDARVSERHLSCARSRGGGKAEKKNRRARQPSASMPSFKRGAPRQAYPARLGLDPKRPQTYPFFAGAHS